MKNIKCSRYITLTFPSRFGNITPTAPGLQLFRGQSIAAGLVSVRPYPYSNQLIINYW